MSKFSFFLTPAGHIFILSDDKDFLYNKAKVIIQYSETACSSQQSQEIMIDKFDSAKQKSDYYELMTEENKLIINPRYTEHCEKVFSYDYQYSLKIDTLLPNYVNKFIFALNFFEAYYLPNVKWNCHGIALMTSGAYPTPIFEDRSYGKFFGLQKIAVSELRPGDIVNFGNHDHSIVYLDKDICLSCNGVRALLKIDSLQNVLKIYGVRSLDSSEIYCYRKPTIPLFSEKLIGLITRQTDLISEMIKFRKTYHNDEELKKNCYNQLFAIVSGIYEECFRDLSESAIDILCSFFHKQIRWYDELTQVDIHENMYHLAKAKRMGLVSYQNSINALNMPYDDFNSYITVLENQLKLEEKTKKKLAQPLKQFLNGLYIELGKIKCACPRNAEYLDSVYNKMQTIFDSYCRGRLSNKEFSKQIHNAIHDANGTLISILHDFGSTSLWSLLDNILWLIDPYRWVTGERLGLFKLAQPTALTIIQNIKQSLRENHQEYDEVVFIPTKKESQLQLVSDKDFSKNPETLAFEGIQRSLLCNVLEMLNTQYKQKQNNPLQQVSSCVLIAVLAIIFYQAFKAYEPGYKQCSPF